LSTATKGRAYEHEVRALFEQAGYSVVRGAGSKGECLKEKTDLVCTKETRQTQFKVILTIVCVQCKVRAR
jgi:Holliday junction resolvase